MRALSFLPAATRTIHDLGLDDLLVGVTFECEADAATPRIVRSRLEGNTLDSAGIDRAVAEAAARGDTLYWIDHELLADADADVVFTQHVCNVCQIGTAIVERAVAALPRPPRIVPLVPRRLADIFDDVATVAGALGRPEAGAALIARSRARIDAVVDDLRARRAPVVRVSFLEWLDPLYACGHWIPDQIALAGGADALGRPGGRSGRLDWDALRDHDPEVLVIAPCGFTPARAETELDRLRDLDGWGELAAVRAGRVHVVDANLFTQPSLSTLVEGIELLAGLLHRWKG